MSDTEVSPFHASLNVPHYHRQNSNKIGTDFDLSAAVKQINDIQDHALDDEDTESIHLINLLEDPDQHGNLDYEDPDQHDNLDYEDPGQSANLDPELSDQSRNFEHQPEDQKDPVFEPTGDLASQVGLQGSQSRMARRRKRLRESGTPVQSKRQRGRNGRVLKAEKLRVETDANLKELNPGRKLPLGCDKKVYTLDELRDRGFKIVEWDGQ